MLADGCDGASLYREPQYVYDAESASCFETTEINQGYPVAAALGSRSICIDCWLDKRLHVPGFYTIILCNFRRQLLQWIDVLRLSIHS